MWALSPAVRSGVPALRRSLHIARKRTPNPTAVTFVPKFVDLLPTAGELGAVCRFRADDLDSSREALYTASPLVASMLQVGSVTEVLLSAESLTVNVENERDWESVGPAVTELMEAHLGDRQHACSPELLMELGGAGYDDELAWGGDSIEAQISQLLDEHIVPYVRGDGGDLRFKGFDHQSGVVKVQMVGACSGCPSSAATLKNKVEALLMHYCPEVQGVEAVEEACGAGAAGEAEGGGERVSLEEHIRRMQEEGEATSIVWPPAGQWIR